MAFVNTYQDARYAEAYSKLEFPGTYYLAYRDLPAIFAEHVHGTRALDFGCGAGRSTRFLRKAGFDVTGIDISGEMIERAKAIDPEGDYRLVHEGDFRDLEAHAFDLVFSGFTFDNVPTREKKVRFFRGLRELLTPEGKIVSVVSSPEIYLHEWASFSTTEFLEANLKAQSGDVVRIINTAIADATPVQDIVWRDGAYREVYTAAGLETARMYKPLGTKEDPVKWINETAIAPWTIYVLRVEPQRRGDFIAVNI